MPLYWSVPAPNTLNQVEKRDSTYFANQFSLILLMWNSIWYHQQKIRIKVLKSMTGFWKNQYDWEISVQNLVFISSRSLLMFIDLVVCVDWSFEINWISQNWINKCIWINKYYISVFQEINLCRIWKLWRRTADLYITLEYT